jgi:acyl-CoA thioesterase-2
VSTPLDDLVKVLDLERLEENLFRGESPETPWQRAFGGQVASQALVAAVRTVPPDRPVHSMHAYFIRGGDTGVPIVYRVQRVRDGRHFTTRAVTAIQHGRTIFYMSASFHLPEDGMEHQDPMPDVPGPEGMPGMHEMADMMRPTSPELADWWDRPLALDVRYVGEPPLAYALRGEVRPPDARVWMRAAGTLPDDPALHACLLTWASDMTLLDSVRLPHANRWDRTPGTMASLDHALWFHRPFRADEWFLYDQHSPSAHGARGLATGKIFSQDGRLICSVVQEGLIRTAPQ